MTKFQKGAAAFAALAVLGVLALGVNAQMMGGAGPAADDHTAREEAEGKAIWEKLEAKDTPCKDLSNDDFERLGEYFMGLMLGDAHPAMNQMMTSMMGEEGEEQMHFVMGKRLSGCDTTAAFPSAGRGFMPMMQMMWGGWGSRGGSGWWGSGPMMGGGSWSWGGLIGLGIIGVVLWLLWWGVIIAAVVLLARWILQRFRGGSALDILKERYARGEISQQEFEEKKRAILS